MKKLGILILGGIFLFPALSFAQDATSTTVATYKSQLLTALYALVQQLETELQTLLAQQQTLQTEQQTVLQEQQNFAGTGVAPVDVSDTITPMPTPSVATSTPPAPPEYPTPEVINFVNNNATFSADNSKNGFTMGTFTIAYSSDWGITMFPVVLSSPSITGIIAQDMYGHIMEQNNPGSTSLIGNIRNYNGEQEVPMMIGINFLPPPGNYTVTVPSITVGDTKVAGLPMSFTFTVASSTNQ